MLARRDQENLVHNHQQAAASKPLNQSTRVAPPKTPGNKYPKTPIKIPLHDENGPPGFGGGKSVLGTKGKGNENLITGGKKGATFDKAAFVTPMGPRTRAPLGMKTTNAKAKAFQTPAGPTNDKTIEKTQIKPTSARRPKLKISHAETVKLDIHGDDTPLKERDVEYCPPKPVDLPYESSDFPEGCLNYEMLKGANLMKGWQEYYLNPVGDDGLTRQERNLEAQLAKSLLQTDERVRKAIEDEEWTVGDVPETFTQNRKKEAQVLQKLKTNMPTKRTLISAKGPATIASRKAASALSVLPKPAPVAVNSSKLVATSKPSFLARVRKPVAQTPINSSETRYTAAAAASRSTIGYTKGRTASNVLSIASMQPRGLARSASTLSAGSETTITPENFTSKREEGSEQRERLKLLGAFDTDDEDLEPGLRGELPECLRSEEEDEEFVISLGPF